MASIAVIKTGGKQYKVEKGTTLRVEKLPKKEGSDVSFAEVLLYVDGKTVEVGTPVVKGVKVVGRILEHGKAKKVIVYKFKRRKRSGTKKGHRQPYTQVEITEISKGASTKAVAAKKPASKTAPASKTVKSSKKA